MRQNFMALDNDEKANFITHFLGFILSSVACLALILKSNSNFEFFIFTIYGLSIIFMFLSSSIYHFTLPGALKEKWLKLDFLSIFLLIGGSYTVFIMLHYNTPFGRFFLGLHWLLIISGIIVKYTTLNKYEILSVIIYVALGWMVIFIYSDITSGMSTIVETLLITGGVLYSIGVYFFILSKRHYYHAIWHTLVLLGCGCHFTAIWLT